RPGRVELHPHEPGAALVHRQPRLPPRPPPQRAHPVLPAPRGHGPAGGATVAGGDLSDSAGRLPLPAAQTLGLGPTAPGGLRGPLTDVPEESRSRKSWPIAVEQCIISRPSLRLT